MSTTNLLFNYVSLCAINQKFIWNPYVGKYVKKARFDDDGQCSEKWLSTYDWIAPRHF